MLTLIKKLSREEADFSTGKLKPNEEDYASTERKRAKGMKKSDMFFYIFLSCCVVALALALIFKPPASPEPGNPGTTGSESDGTPWHGKQAIEHQVEVKHIEIPGIDTLYLKAGQTEQQVNFYNPDANDCSMEFSLSIGEDLLWKSGKCQPGYGFYTIELEHPLETGTYKGTLLHECERNGKALNSARMNLEIEVN